MPEKIKTCFKLCQEKVKRLQKHKDHHSSWQSRNVEKRKYGGAITSFDSPLIGSISGFVEHGDEAIMLVIWHIMGWIPLEEAKEIANFSSNNMFLPLLEVCKDLLNK